MEFSTYKFVDFVEEEDRVVCASVLQALDDAARHGSYIRPPVASDVRLVTHSSKGNPTKTYTHTSEWSHTYLPNTLTHLRVLADIWKQGVQIEVS